MDPILIKRIHRLHFFKFDGIEYLTVNDNSSLDQFNLKSRRVYFFPLINNGVIICIRSC